jgi:hypothetical protein
MLFLKVGEDDGSGCKLKKRSDPVGGARVDIWQSPTGTYIVGIASTEYGGKDVRTGIKLWEEAECEFDRRVSLLKIRKGGKVWHPPYAHRVDLLIHKPNEQALVCAMLEVEIGKVKKKSPGLDQQSHSNFGEDVTLMGWVINNRELPITVVVVMLDTDSLSSAQEAVKRCEKEAKRIKDNLFNDLSGCYIYFATSCPSGFKPCWWPHEPG